MFIDLVASLRCLTPHEDGWLVAVSRRMEGRSILEGTLGCPVCRREYPIVGGVGYFGVDAGAPAPAAASAPAPPLDEESAVRLAAFLGLQSPGGIVVLCGAWAGLAPALRQIVPVSCVLVDPPRDDELVGEGMATLRTAGAIPLAAGSVRGVALDTLSADEGTLGAALRVLSSRGHLVAPVRLVPPAGVEELARDDELWVARTRLASSAPVGIARGARPIR